MDIKAIREQVKQDRLSHHHYRDDWCNLKCSLSIEQSSDLLDALEEALGLLEKVPRNRLPIGSLGLK